MSKRSLVFALLLAPAGALAAQAGGAEAAGVGSGWGAFTQLEFIFHMAVVLLAALGLSALIAYHPVMRRKAASIEELDQPKTFLFYGLVGAVVAEIVRVQPEMGLVVFGIGGLLRFRSVLDEATDTGQVILVTVVGLCCGLELFVVAVLATLFGWLLIYFLEREHTLRLMIKAVDPSKMAAASDAYGKLLREAGCSILGERKTPVKHTFAFDLRLPAGTTRLDLEAKLATIPVDLRGAIDWEAK